MRGREGGLEPKQMPNMRASSRRFSYLMTAPIALLGGGGRGRHRSRLGWGMAALTRGGFEVRLTVFRAEALDSEEI